MSVYNEYSKLKTVFLGKRFTEKIVRDQFKYVGNEEFIQAMIRLNSETNEDLDAIEAYLTSIGVEVFRPNLDVYWELKSFANEFQIFDPGSCRDWCFAYGDTIIIGQTSLRERIHEYLFFEDALQTLEKRGKTIVSYPVQPIPNMQILDKDYENKSFDYHLKTIKEFINNHKDSKNKLLLDQSRFHSKLLKGLSLSFYKSFYIYNYNNLIKNKILFHTASYFKHNNIIYGTPQGTCLGIEYFKKHIEKINPNVKFVYRLGEFGHIDGNSNILDENLVVYSNNCEGDTYGYSEEFDLTGIKLQSSGKGMAITTFDYDDNFKSLESYLNEQFETRPEGVFEYFQNLKGYDQRVDFDLNGLTVAPKKMIGNFFDKEKLKFLEKFDVEVINLPMRHRWILDGGIHCYTSDIDRE